MKVKQVNENTSAVEGYRGRRDAYQRDYDSSVSGMGRRQSQAYQDDGGANDERHDLDPSDWYIVRDGKMFKLSVYPNQEQEAMSRGYSRTRDEARARASNEGVTEMDGAPGQILAATGDKVTIDNKDGTQTIAPKASLTRDPTGKGFVLSKTPTPGGEKPDEPKPGETVFKPATTEGTEKMNEAIKILRLAGLHNAADKLMEQQLFENPWQGTDPAKAAAWAKLSPQVQQKLGKADPMDSTIVSRMVKGGFLSGKPVTDANPDGTPKAGAAPAAAPAAAAPGQVTSGSGVPVTSGSGAPVTTGSAPAAPAAPAPAAPAAQKVDPDQADRDDAEQGAAMRANAAGGNSTSAATGAGNPGEEAAAELARIKQLAGQPTAADQDDADMGAAMKANAQAAKEKEYANSADQADADMGAAMTANAQAATQAANGVNAAGQNVTMPDGTNPETGEKTASSVNAAGQNVTMPDGTNPETGEKTATAAAPAAPTQAASPAAAPAAAKPAAKSDPNIKALQDKLIAAGAKIKADGIMGPQTRTAMQQFPKAVSGNVPLPQGVAPSTAGGGRGGQGGPTAAQGTAPRPGVNQPATQPGAGQKGPTKAAAAGQDPTNPLNKKTAEDRQFYEELNKMLTIAKLR